MQKYFQEINKIKQTSLLKELTDEIKENKVTEFVINNKILAPKTTENSINFLKTIYPNHKEKKIIETSIASIPNITYLQNFIYWQKNDLIEEKKRLTTIKVSRYSNLKLCSKTLTPKSILIYLN